VTVAIALQVHDGVVLASDSALTLSHTNAAGVDTVLNVYNNGNKIFNLKKGLPIGAVFYGKGSIGTSSVSTLVKDLRRRFSGDSPNHKSWRIDHKNYTIKDVADRAREFLFDEKFSALGITAPGTAFGFIVAGYSSGAQLSEVWMFDIIAGKCDPAREIIPQGQASAYVGGDPDVFCRLANGVGVEIESALAKIGVPATEVAAKADIIRQELATPLVEAPMPIRDAIDLAEFFVDTTATFTRFKRGSGTVGGPTESAAITKHEGFKWVRRKHYFDESLNPRVTP
jgi:hypothetical protein